MAVTTTAERKDRRGVAAVISGVEAALLGLVVLRLLRASRVDRAIDRPRVGHRNLLAALIVLGLVALAVAACIGLARRRDWGRPVAYIVQGVLAALGLAIVSSRPVVGIACLAVAAVTAWLVSSGRPPNHFVPPPTSSPPTPPSAT